MFGTFLTASNTQGDPLKDLATVNAAQAGDQLNITNAVVDSPDTGDLTVTVDNTGSRSTPDFSTMDVILEYTDTSNNAVVIYLEHTTSAPGNNQWTIPGSGISPDSFNPNMWDPDEVLTIDVLVSPAVKSNTAATVGGYAMGHQRLVAGDEFLSIKSRSSRVGVGYRQHRRQAWRLPSKAWR